MAVLFSVPLLAGAQQRDLDALLPEKQMGILFYDVMNCDSLFGKDRLFAEPKTFLDMQPRRSLAWIKKDYETLQRHHVSTLIEFINKNFTQPIVPATTFTAHGDIDSHIRQLWSLLRRALLSTSNIPILYLAGVSVKFIIGTPISRCLEWWLTEKGSWRVIWWIISRS